MKVKVCISENETFEIVENVVPAFESREGVNNIVASLRVDISWLLVSFGYNGMRLDLL